MGRFLIWLSGARRQILDECPTERPKYVGIGASILITATMAAVSLAFVLVTALRVELWLAVPSVIAWGLAILSLERLFVVSLPRGGTWHAQLLRASPLVLLALLLGVVTSTPLVLQIFRPEIEHEITILHTQAENAYLAGGRNSQLQQEITRDQDQVKNIVSTQAKNKAKADPELPIVQKALQAAQTEQAQELSTFTSKNENNWGLLIRLHALDAVTSHDPTLNAARWVLFLLFVVIDCMPVMIKVMLNLGPENNYDRLLEAEERIQLRVAANNREFREAAWRADIPEVTQDIIAARERVERKKLEAWEKAQTLRLLDEEAAMRRSRSEGSQQPQGAPVSESDVSTGSSMSVISPPRRSLCQAFTDGLGGVFDLFGGIEHARPIVPTFEEIAADDAPALCRALELVPGVENGGEDGVEQ